MFKNLSCASLGLSSNLSDTIELALSYGFKGIEVDLAEFAASSEMPGLTNGRKRLESAKLKIGVFRLPVAWDGEEAELRRDMKRFPALARLAYEMGCRVCWTTVQPGSDRRPFHENFEFHRRRLTELAQELEPTGIKLALGFVASTVARQNSAFEFLHTFDGLVTLHGMIASRNVGIVFDTWQIHSCGGDMGLAAKLAAERKIALVNVSDAKTADAPPFGSDENCTLPGETGVIDLIPLFAALGEGGYDGPIAPQTHAANIRHLRRDAIVKQAAQGIDAAWKAAGLNPAGKMAARV